MIWYFRSKLKIAKGYKYDCVELKKRIIVKKFTILKSQSAMDKDELRWPKRANPFGQRAWSGSTLWFLLIKNIFYFNLKILLNLKQINNKKLNANWETRMQNAAEKEETLPPSAFTASPLATPPRRRARRLFPLPFIVPTLRPRLQSFSTTDSFK